MPLFLVERSYAYDLELTADDIAGIKAINDAAGARWVSSFLSADKRRTYCLFEAPSEEAIREAVRLGSPPIDAIIPVEEIPTGPVSPGAVFP
jgi:hypothetical protein